MKINLIKLFAIAIISLPLLAVTFFQDANKVSAIPNAASDVAADYKTKCAACHGAAATKFFDPAKSVEEHTEIILKGKKGEKPPFMPGYETKGMTPEQAKALAEYMIELRNTSN